MAWQEPQRRSSTPVSANNPFRQSMLLRSESPVHEDSIYAMYSRSASSLNDPLSTGPNPAAAASDESAAPPSLPRTRNIHFNRLQAEERAVRRSSNPFQPEMDLAQQSHGSQSSRSSQPLEPPPAYEDRRRANSDSSALGESEKERLARYEERHDQSQRRYPSTRQYDSASDEALRDRERQLAARERKYREEHERLRAEREKLRAERHRLRASAGREGSGSADARDGSHREREKLSREKPSREFEKHERSERSDRDRERSDRTKHKSSSRRARSKSEPKAKDRPLDVIDKMDVTGLFGPGSFHHDGPFDACTPHRNKTGRTAAPLKAYAADGPNNSLAVVDPSIGNYKKEQTVFGNSGVEDALMSEPAGPERHGRAVHGPSSLGLGSTTFLDGVPASSTAQAEANRERANSGNLGRTRSILRRQGSRANRPQLEVPPRPHLETRNSSPETYRPEPAAEKERPSGLLGRVKSLRIKR